MEKKVLDELVKYLRAGKVTVRVENSKVVVVAGGEKTSGFVCGVLGLVRAVQPLLEGGSPLEQSLTHSWLTYCVTHLFHCATYEALNGCLQYINKELENRAYLCGFRATVADMALFLALHPFVANWSFIQKEQYLNVSRWFRNLQNTDGLCQTHAPVQFSRTQLYGELARVH